MSDCTHECDSCGQNCSERAGQGSLRKQPHEKSRIGKVIGVVSGKGGVGKSTIACTLACAMVRMGKRVGILDADITGPSIPKAFGVDEDALANEEGILPAVTRGGIRIMSLNLMMEEETDPVIWRGPVIAGAVTQFWTDVIWGDLDYLFVDMPPGTGDVPLTVFQSLPVDGVVVVTSPQDLVSMIVTKAVKMAEMMGIPVLGFVENYSFFRCPDCGKEYAVFGNSGLDQLAETFQIPVLARLPIDPGLAGAMDEGTVETFEPNPMTEAAAELEQILS